jgi:raffinose/stachyose/melibiose transport system substrate-binding protein
MKKVFILFLVVVMMVSFVFLTSGCRNEAQEIIEETTEEIKMEEEALEPVDEETIETVASESDITLTVWWIIAVPDAVKDMFDRYTAKTGVKFDLIPSIEATGEALLTKWNAGDRPDILNWTASTNVLMQIRPEETLVDLSDLPFVENAIGDVLKSATVNGRVYGAQLLPPTYYNIIYNKNAFDEAGIEIGTPGDLKGTPVGWDGFLEVCEELQAVGKTPIYVGGGDMWPLQINSFLWWSEAFHYTDLIERLSANKAEFTSSEFIQGLEKGLEMREHYNEDFLTASYDDMIVNIMTGDVGMVFLGSFAIDALVATYGMDEVNNNIGAFPISEEGNILVWQSTANQSTMFVPNTGDEEKIQASKDFIAWATSEGYQDFINMTKASPVFEGFESPELPQPIIQLNNWVEKGISEAVFAEFLPAGYGPLHVYLQEMYAGIKQPNDVMEATQIDYVKNAQTIGIEGF